LEWIFKNPILRARGTPPLSAGKAFLDRGRGGKLADFKERNFFLLGAWKAPPLGPQPREGAWGLEVRLRRAASPGPRWQGQGDPRGRRSRGKKGWGRQRRGIFFRRGHGAQRFGGEGLLGTWGWEPFQGHKEAASRAWGLCGGSSSGEISSGAKTLATKESPPAGPKPGFTGGRFRVTCGDALGAGAEGRTTLG